MRYAIRLLATYTVMAYVDVPGVSISMVMVTSYISTLNDTVIDFEWDWLLLTTGIILLHQVTQYGILF